MTIEGTLSHKERPDLMVAYTLANSILISHRSIITKINPQMKIEGILSHKERRDLICDQGISHICTTEHSAQSSNS